MRTQAGGTHGLMGKSLGSDRLARFRRVRMAAPVDFAPARVLSPGSEADLPSLPPGFRVSPDAKNLVKLNEEVSRMETARLPQLILLYILQS